MLKVKVSSMLSPKSNRPVANQFIINTDEGAFFQSYQTVIAHNNNGKTTLDPDWNYSRTTSKYLYRFLSLDRRQILKGIKDGSIKVENLN